MAQFSRALLIGLMAGAWFYISGILGLPTWPGFIGWSFYFVAGATPPALYKAGLPLFAGAFLAIGALYAMTPLGSMAPLAIVAIATIMMLLGSHPLFAVIPAQFAGAASFFGVLSSGVDAGQALAHTLITLAIGLVIGIISIVVPDMILGKPGAAKS